MDWIRDEYAYGDYGMVRAWLVASSFAPGVADFAVEARVRRYTVGRRPPRSEEWADLGLVEYSAGPEGRVTFQRI